MVVEELRRGAPGIRERAGRQDALIDARIRVGDPLLRERPAGAARTDRVSKGSVGLGDVLLGHHEGLGLQREIAVVTAVVQSRRHRHEALAERSACGRAPGRRRGGARLMVNPTRRSVRDQQLVVELWLRRERRPRLVRLIEDGDLVLVAIHVAGLDAHDERDLDALIRRRLSDVRRWARRVIWLEPRLGRVRRRVQVVEGRSLVASLIHRSCLAGPRLKLRAREHWPARRMVDQRDLGSPPAAAGSPAGRCVRAQDRQRGPRSDRPAETRTPLVTLRRPRITAMRLASARLGQTDRHECRSAADQVRPT